MRDRSDFSTLNPEQDQQIAELIAEVQRAGDTLGGIIEIRVEGVPFGLGTHTQWDRRLDGRLAQAVMAVQAIKGVEIGLGFEAARLAAPKCMIPSSSIPTGPRGPRSAWDVPATTRAAWKPA